MSAIDYSKPTISLGNCDGCGYPVIPGDAGYWKSDWNGQPRQRHINCTRAAYLHGKREGYADAVRMLKAARKALRAQGDATP